MDRLGLQAFLRVAELGSFSLAAESLYLTQPAISKRIAGLEQSLNCKLFDRLNKRIVLTESGHKLLPQAQNILFAMDEAAATVTASDQVGDKQIGGTLKIAVSYYVAQHYLLNPLKTFLDTYSEVDAQVEIVTTEVAQNKLLKGEIDIALGTLSNKRASAIHYHELWQEKLNFVCNAAFKSKNKPKTLQDLAKTTAILPGPETEFFQQLSSLLQVNLITIDRHQIINQLDGIYKLVKAGLGWSLLPESLNRQLEVCKIYDNENTKNRVKLNRLLGAMTHKKRTSSLALKAFIKELSIGTAD